MIILLLILFIVIMFLSSGLNNVPMTIDSTFRDKQYPNQAIMQIFPNNNTKLNFTYQIEIYKDDVLRYKVNAIFRSSSVDKFTGEGALQFSFLLTPEEVLQSPYSPRAFELDASRSEDIGKWFDVRVIDNGKIISLQPSAVKSKTPTQDAIVVVLLITVPLFIIFIIFRLLGIGGGGGGPTHKYEITIKKLE